jgi:hypothetical protein
MISCTEPGLRKALYILYMLKTDLLLLTVTLESDKPVLSSEAAPHINKPAGI